MNFEEFIKTLAGSVIRATVRYFRNIPHRIKSFFIKEITKYKELPPRKEKNKVYVLVGYTTKSHIDSKYNKEKYMMICKKGLIALIFVLLLFIGMKKILPFIDINQYNKIFGVGNGVEMTEFDPFAP